MIHLFARLWRGTKKISQLRFIQISLLMLSLFLYSATGYMYFEFKVNPDLNWGDAFWWTIVTMTTVGYGDFFPTTLGGRWLIGFPSMLLGIGLLGYGLSLIATKMLESQALEVKGLKKVMCFEHVAICGWSSLERTLKLIGEIRSDSTTIESPIVLITDQIPELPPELRKIDKMFFVSGDPARESTLEMANIKEAHAVIIQANLEEAERADDVNLKVALAVECYHPDTFTVAECVNPENVPYFRRANCDSVVCISQLSEQILVQELHDPGITEVVSQLTTSQAGKQLIIAAPGKPYSTYGDASDAYSRQGVLLIGIRRDRQNQILPPADFELKDKDRLVMICEKRPD